MKRSHRSLAFLGCCALLGCGSSPPVKYYTLHEIPAAVAPASVASSVPVRLQPVVVASELDRIEIVSRIGPDRLHIADSELWAAPLEGQIRAVLSSDLATRLPPLLVVDPNEPGTNESRRLLSVSILEFLGDQTCAVRLRADWILRAPKGGEERGAELVQIPADAACAGAAAGQMSLALAELADRLAGVISRNEAASTPSPGGG